MQIKSSRLAASILFIAVGGIVAAIGVSMANPGHPHQAMVVVLFDCLFIIVAIVMERFRYRPTINTADKGWEPTDERYIDPGSGEQMRVWFNPNSGQRDYRSDK